MQPPVQPAIPTAAASNVKVYPKSTRPVRNTRMSDLAKESQKNELTFSLYASVNRELRAVADVIFKKTSGEEVTVETFEACVKEIEEKAEFITSEYAKLVQLSNNQAEAKIKKYLEFFYL